MCWGHQNPGMGIASVGVRRGQGLILVVSRWQGAPDAGAGQEEDRNCAELLMVLLRVLTPRR